MLSSIYLVNSVAFPFLSALITSSKPDNGLNDIRAKMNKAPKRVNIFFIKTGFVLSSISQICAIVEELRLRHENKQNLYVYIALHPILKFINVKY